MEEIDLTVTPDVESIIAQRVADATKGLFTEDDLNKRVISEVDRRVESGIQKGLETQKQKWEREYKEVAMLSAEDVAKRQYEEQLKTLTQKEVEVQKRSNKLEAMDLLASANVPKSHYDKFIGILVSDDADATKLNVENFIEMFNSTKTEIETKLKSEISRVPTPQVQTQTGAITKTEFAKMTYAQVLHLKQTNPELYKEFIK